MEPIPKQLIPLLLIAGVVAWLAVNAFSSMIFGSLGTTAADPAWSYVVALGISLAIAGASCGIRVKIGSKSMVGRFVTTISGTASSALLGFYYGGTITNNNPQIAIASAVFGGIVIASAIIFVRRKFVAVAVTVVGTVASYGFAFFVASIAIAYLSVQKFLAGVIWGSLSVGYIWLTINSLTLLVRELREG
ncbi:MAG: hypothetical protein F6K41_24275 [Symploca sp. SIO3E6]|nr:hypothetical protein [Caldora sp. SIO3E6]